ncbi:MAG: cytidylate kinase-like family protein, partial [Clostridia bacterium]|nr:cytidylate kinase-like family protein [Clostridia bacterium]
MNTIITIGRELGSGGRTIGRAVAMKVGITDYDREIIDKTAEES